MRMAETDESLQDLTANSRLGLKGKRKRKSVDTTTFTLHEK